MTESEVREAVALVDWYKNHMLTESKHEKAFEVLLSLAERYLAQEGKMPKKKGCYQNKKWKGTYPQDCEAAGWNNAIDACQLAMVEMVKPLGENGK